MPCGPHGPARSVSAVVIALVLAALAVAFALSSLDALGLQHTIPGPGRILLALAVAALAEWALGLPALPYALIAVPAVTYVGAAAQAYVEHLINRAAVIEPRRRVPRL